MVESRVLSVVLDKLTFSEAKNYFVMLELDEGVMQGGAKQRTEVSQVTNNPRFATRNFRFPSMVAWEENDTNLVLSVMEVVQQSGKKGSANTFGVCRVALSKHKAALLRGESVSLDLTVEPSGGSSRTGQLECTLSLPTASDGRGSSPNSTQVVDPRDN